MKTYLFKIGSFEIRIYSLMYIIALLLAIFIAGKDKKSCINNKKDVEDFAYTALFSGLIGARIYYVLLKWEYYSLYPQDILAVWKGGLAIHGGIIGGIIGVIIFSKIKNYNFFDLTDLAVSPLILGQALGRIGNLANGEIHGVPTFTPISVIIKGNFKEWWAYYNSLTVLEQSKFKNIVPWGIVFPDNTPAGIEFPSYKLHTAMIYELILNFIAFLIMFFVLRKKNLNRGILSMCYLIFYGVIRIIVSTFRAEDLMFYGIKAPYIISTIMIIVGILGIIILNNKGKK